VLRGNTVSTCSRMSVQRIRVSDDLGHVHVCPSAVRNLLLSLGFAVHVDLAERRTRRDGRHGEQCPSPPSSAPAGAGTDLPSTATTRPPNVRRPRTPSPDPGVDRHVEEWAPSRRCQTRRIDGPPCTCLALRAAAPRRAGREPDRRSPIKNLADSAVVAKSAVDDVCASSEARVTATSLPPLRCRSACRG